MPARISKLPKTAGDDTLGKILTSAAIVEIGTGLALLLVPAIVVRLLIGTFETSEAIPLARLAGIALLALGLACWPSGQRALFRSPAFRAMLTYNVLVALFLAYLFIVGHLRGVLLWPGVGLHAVVAVLLIWTWRDERRAKESDR